MYHNVQSFPYYHKSVHGDSNVQALDLCSKPAIIEVKKESSTSNLNVYDKKTGFVPTLHHSISLPADLSIIQNDLNDTVSKNQRIGSTMSLEEELKDFSHSEIRLPPKKRKKMLAHAINQMYLNCDMEQPLNMTMEELKHSHNIVRTMKRKLDSENSSINIQYHTSSEFRNSAPPVLAQPIPATLSFSPTVNNVSDKSVRFTSRGFIQGNFLMDLFYFPPKHVFFVNVIYN